MKLSKLFFHAANANISSKVGSCYTQRRLGGVIVRYAEVSAKVIDNDVQRLISVIFGGQIPRFEPLEWTIQRQQ